MYYCVFGTPTNLQDLDTGLCYKGGIVQKDDDRCKNVKCEPPNIKPSEINTEKPVIENNCDINNGGCDINADCNQLDNGKIQCRCKHDYIGNGVKCYPKGNIYGDCSNKETGMYCYPNDCCSYYYWCVDGKPQPIQQPGVNSVCYNGTIIPYDDDICEDYECDSSMCGDGICENVEDCNTCPQDCGKCIICGDGICTYPEKCDVCYEDCGYSSITTIPPTNPTAVITGTYSEYDYTWIIIIICVTIMILAILGLMAYIFYPKKIKYESNSAVI